MEVSSKFYASKRKLFQLSEVLIMITIESTLVLVTLLSLHILGLSLLSLLLPKNPGQNVIRVNDTQSKNIGYYDRNKAINSNDDKC